MRHITTLLLLLIFSGCSTAYGEEKVSFWSNVDKFLGEIADGISKKIRLQGSELLIAHSITRRIIADMVRKH